MTPGVVHSAFFSNSNRYRVISLGYVATVYPVASRGLSRNGDAPIASSRSYRVYVFYPDGSLRATANFDVCGSTVNATAMANYLNALPIGTLVLISTHDEPQTNRLATDLYNAMLRCGASAAVYGSAAFQYRSAYVLMGKVSGVAGSSYQWYSGDVSSDVNAAILVDFEIEGGDFKVSRAIVS